MQPTRIAVASSLLFVAAACDKGSSSGGAPRQGSLLPEPSAAHPTPAPAAQSSPDIDTAPLSKQLGCGSARHREACRILDEFGRATRWNQQIPSGEGRWVGHSNSVDKGADKAELYIFVARQVPTSTVGPTELPIRIGTGVFPEDKHDAALKLVNALSRFDTVPRSNQALAYLKGWTSGDEKGAIATQGPSVRLVSDHETYVRQGSGQKLLVVVVRASGASPGDGLYAEVWPATW
jgi:hypothetical protein